MLWILSVACMLKFNHEKKPCLLYRRPIYHWIKKVGDLSKGMIVQTAFSLGDGD